MADPGRTPSAGHVRRIVFHHLTFWIALGVLLVALVIDVLAGYGRLALGRPLAANGPDATTFISTLVAIYGLFLSVYGALVPLLTDPKRSFRGGVEATIMLLVVAAIGIDLYRIVNTIGDLYTTSTRSLTAAGLDDIRFEFTNYWFPANVTVIILGLYGVLRLRDSEVPVGGAQDSSRS